MFPEFKIILQTSAGVKLILLASIHHSAQQSHRFSNLSILLPVVKQPQVGKKHAKMVCVVDGLFTLNLFLF